MADYTTTDDAIAAIKALPACASFSTYPGSFVVTYPSTYKIPGGCMVKRGSDDLTALNSLYDNVVKWWGAQRLQTTV